VHLFVDRGVQVEGADRAAARRHALPVQGVDQGLGEPAQRAAPGIGELFLLAGGQDDAPAAGRE